MSIELSRWRLVACVAPAVSIIYYLACLWKAFPALPIEVPTHFGLDGAPNGWMNRTAWLVLSPVLLAAMLSLVFVVRPSVAAPLAPLTALLFWSTSGLLAGAFLQIVHSAERRARIQFLPLLFWAVLLPLAQAAAMALTRSWWLQD